ncbi:MAG: beta-ketoacyl-ACP synthase I [Rhodobacteraceae bacterium]|nr:beta-ketoacyl-ACP synthase I [Paracoccaceae bacterium]
MSLRRVAITGMGIISPIGNNKQEVTHSLRRGKSGIEFSEEYAENGFRSQVHGNIKIDLVAEVNKRLLRFMGPGAAYNYLAMEQAVADSGLEDNEVSNEKTGMVMGSGGPSTSNFFNAHKIVAERKNPRKMGPFMVTRCMSSTNSACLATPFKIKGPSYSITSACSTSAHCIGHAYEQIMFGIQDIMFAGGGEEIDWTLSCLFDAMGALSAKYNDTPQIASRPFDVDRDGFVIAGGAGVLVLEEMDRALARGAKVYAEIIGYGATSDGHDMVAPSGDGGFRSMKKAISTIGNRNIDYINAHGTSTPVGDTTEIAAVRKLFENKKQPFLSSTKSLTGHSLGATGVHEAIYSLIMMEENFVTASANVDNLDPSIHPHEVTTERLDEVKIDAILSNSFGFGGTNASLVFGRID